MSKPALLLLFYVNFFTEYPIHPAHKSGVRERKNEKVHNASMKKGIATNLAETCHVGDGKVTMCKKKGVSWNWKMLVLFGQCIIISHDIVFPGD